MRDEKLQVTALAAGEMALMFGGEDSFGGDIGKVLGAIIGGAVYLITHPPQADYAYAKVGYSS